jgi:hypothetical protein
MVQGTHEDSSHYFIISVKPQNMKVHFFAVGLLADVSATSFSGQGIDKVGGIMMRSLQEGMPCYSEGEAIGICLVLEEACSYCPLNIVVASGMEGCSSSEVESFSPSSRVAVLTSATETVSMNCRRE